MESSAGIDEAVFAEMVNDRSNSGAYCSDQELLIVSRKLPKVKVQPNMQSKGTGEIMNQGAVTVGAVSPKLDRPSPVQVASPSDAPCLDNRCRQPSNVIESEPIADAAPANIGEATIAAHSRVSSGADLCSESKQAAPAKWADLCDDKPGPPAARRGPSRPVTKVGSSSREKPWVPQLRPAIAPKMEPLSPTVANHSKPSEEQRPKDLIVVSMPAAAGIRMQAPVFEDDDEWEDPRPEVQQGRPKEKEDLHDAERQAQPQGEAQLRGKHSWGDMEDDEPLEVEANGGEESDGDIFMNTCIDCGETWLLSIDFGEEFWCEDAGKPCGVSASKAAASTFSFGEPVDTEEEAGRCDATSTLRSRLLCRVLSEGLIGVDCAGIFFEKGLVPPKPSEIEAFRAEMQRRRAERAAAIKKEGAREGERMKHKKQQRYLNGQLVDVQRGSKYLVEPKESATDRQKTSCNLVIIGSRSHSSRQSEKKGPKS